MFVHGKSTSSSNHIYQHMCICISDLYNKTIHNFILFLVMKVLNHYGSPLNTGVLILMHPDQLFPVINGQEEGLKW